MIKVRPILCSQCGATIVMEKIINTGLTNVFRCEYCGTMLEILGYTVSSGTSKFYTKNLKDVLPNSDVSVHYRMSLKDTEIMYGVTPAIKVLFYLTILISFCAIFFIPEALKRAMPKDFFQIPDFWLLLLILFIECFGIPFIIYYTIMIKSAKDFYNNNDLPKELGDD